MFSAQVCPLKLEQLHRYTVVERHFHKYNLSEGTLRQLWVNQALQVNFNDRNCHIPSISSPIIYMLCSKQRKETLKRMSQL